MEKIKFNVYEYDCKEGKSLFSEGVKREFGENKVVIVDGHQIIAIVKPLQDSGGLKLIGYLYAYPTSNHNHRGYE